MDYISAKEAAKKWGIGERRVQFFCSNEKIPGAIVMGRQWMIPSDAEKPVDGRSKGSRKSNNLMPYHFPIFTFSRYFSNTNVLTEEEKALLAAQTMHLEGYYFDSIKLCRSIIQETISQSVIFGATITLAYDFLMTGLIIEYQNTLKKLQTIVENETLHQEDYKLIVYFLTFHSTKDPKELLSIDTTKLSSEAFDYFYYVAIMLGIITNSNPTQETLMMYETLEKRFELENLLPLALAFCSILGAIFSIKEDKEKGESYITKACTIACSNNWINYLSKFYFPMQTVFDKVMKEHHPEQVKKLLECGQSNISSWNKITAIVTNKIPLNGIIPEEFELVILLSWDLSDEDIKDVMGITVQDLENKLSKIYTKLGVEKREELVIISKKVLR